MEEAPMSHDAGPAGREPAEGYAGAGSPWAAPPESGEQRPDAPGQPTGQARARAQVPQARGSASVQPPTGSASVQPPTGSPAGDDPWQSAGPPPAPWREPGDPGPDPAGHGADRGYQHPTERAPRNDSSPWPAGTDAWQGERERPGPYPPVGPDPNTLANPTMPHYQPSSQYAPQPPPPPAQTSGSAAVPAANRASGAASVPGPGSPAAAGGGYPDSPGPAGAAGGVSSGRAHVPGPGGEQPPTGVYGRRPGDDGDAPAATTAFPAYGAATPPRPDEPGQGTYGQPGYGQPDYGQPDYGQPDYRPGQTAYGQPEYGQTERLGQAPVQPDPFSRSQGQYGGPTGYGDSQTQRFDPHGSPSGAYPAQPGYPPTGGYPTQPAGVYGAAGAQPSSGYDPYGGYDETGPVGGGPSLAAPTPQRSRKLLIVLVAVAVVTVVAAIVTGFAVAGGTGTDFAVGSCVKQSGGQAMKADCTEAKAYKVTSTVAKQADCPDANQPVVILTEGKTQHVLCLRPAAQK